ncbi:uncharacterized protein LY79DRAFT_576602 [Colletotrichum navitas]|uniref:Uncharacterized protein n=1 Tax=Colletotrichum navitas TaxID=681940 RepID=A0AAD8V7M6_9PEZI|nr:uncharacterized protein LY79DRAFT_576602 [Colletotrichum navitas]KAK1597287.1 hypothetical protein LY79DRAFT_576602 [Colletotrichum navitas]
MIQQASGERLPGCVCTGPSTTTRYPNIPPSGLPFRPPLRLRPLPWRSTISIPSKEKPYGAYGDHEGRARVSSPEAQGLDRLSLDVDMRIPATISPSGPASPAASIRSFPPYTTSKQCRGVGIERTGQNLRSMMGFPTWMRRAERAGTLRRGRGRCRAGSVSVFAVQPDPSFAD